MSEVNVLYQKMPVYRARMFNVDQVGNIMYICVYVNVRRIDERYKLINVKYIIVKCNSLIEFNFCLCSA